MSMPRVVFLICLGYVILFIVKQILLFFRGGQSRG
jgi:hypothetical protein